MGGKTEKNEKEVKLIGGYNNQLKYSDCSRNDTIDKIMCILDVLEINHGSMEKVEQKDTYYDTKNLKILKHKGCVRIREKIIDDVKEIRLTVKSKENKCVPFLPDNLSRNEDEYVIRAYGKKDKDACANVYAKEKFGLEEGVSPQLLVFNQRHFCKIQTEFYEYELAYDKYTYINPHDNSESGEFYEIEIELNESKEDISQIDDKIFKLAELFKNVMGFNSDGKSKYERGIDWKEKMIESENQIFLMFDIVEYSINTSLEQRRKIDKLTSIVKRELSNISGEYQVFPIGDGMIICVSDKINIMPYLYAILESVHKNNQITPEKMHIILRSSIHIGRVVPYTDINDKKNYAGHGINIVCRINSQAEKNQILVSEDFYDYMKDKELITESYSNKFLITVKHGVEIAVRNFYDSPIGINNRRIYHGVM